MAQEFHNFVDVIGSEDRRLAFLADAIRMAPVWGWDWVACKINKAASHGGDSGKSKADFYSRGFPQGLQELMRLHPTIILEGEFLDISGDRLYRMRLQNNFIVTQSEEPLKWEEPVKVAPGRITKKPIRPPKDPPTDAQDLPLLDAEKHLLADAELQAEIDAFTPDDDNPPRFVPPRPAGETLKGIDNI